MTCLRLPLPTRTLAGFLAVLLLAPTVAARGQVGGAGDGRTESAVTEVGARTAEELAVCLQQRPNLAVAVLIDETGSLKRTDPGNERAPVLAAFLRRLEDLAGAELGDRTRQVLVTVAYFGTGVDEFLPWQPIGTPQPDPARGRDARRSISRTILDETPPRNNDLTTEFSAALSWAADRHREVPRLVDPSSVCTLTVWFSDGELDPDNRPQFPYEREAVIAETATLCDAGGVLDDHRSTGATLVGILLVELLTESSSVTTLPRMHAMVEGVDPTGRRCGAAGSRGLYLEGGLDLLSLQFERAVTPGQGGVLQGTYRGDPITFVVDRGVSKVRVVMSAREGFRLTTSTGGRVEVASPDAAPATAGLPRGVSPDIRWSSGAVSVDLEVAGAYGEWQIERQGRTSETDVYYFADLRIEVDAEGAQLTSGDPGSVTGRIVDGAGAPLARDDYASSTLDVVADGRTAEVELRPDGTFRATFPVETDEARIVAALRLDLITSGGTVLQPVTRDVLLPVTLPGWFPRVDIASEFDRSLAPRREEARLRIVATGSDLGPTRVCVRPGTPGDGAQELVRLVGIGWADRDLSRCIELAPGERLEADLLATLQGSDIRSVRVGIPLTVVLESAAIDGRASVTVDYPEQRSITVEPPRPNPLIVIVLLLLGLLIPLGVLHLLNRAAARFRTRNLQAARVPVTLVRSHGSWRVERAGVAGGAPRQLVGADELKYLPTQGPDGQSEWTATSATPEDGATAGERWRAIVPRWPLGTVRAIVDAPPGHRIVSNEVPTFTDDGTQAGIGLNPQRCAYLLVPDGELRGLDAVDDVRIPATLVTVLGHAGPAMHDVVADHASQLEVILVGGGGEVDRLAAAVLAADAAQAAGAAASDGLSADTAAAATGASGWGAGLTSTSGWDAGASTSDTARRASSTGDVWGTPPSSPPPSSPPSPPPPSRPAWDPPGGRPPSGPGPGTGGGRTPGWD